MFVQIAAMENFSLELMNVPNANGMIWATSRFVFWVLGVVSYQHSRFQLPYTCSHLRASLFCQNFGRWEVGSSSCVSWHWGWAVSSLMLLNQHGAPVVVALFLCSELTCITVTSLTINHQVFQPTRRQMSLLLGGHRLLVVSSLGFNGLYTSSLVANKAAIRGRL